MQTRAAHHLSRFAAIAVSAVKGATLLYQHTQGADIDTLAQTYDAYPADIGLLKTHLGWVLDAADRIFGVLSRPPKGSEEDKQAPSTPTPHQDLARILKQMVEYGIPRDALGLTAIPGIGPKRAQVVVALGIRTPAQLAAAEAVTIATPVRLSLATVARLQEQACGLLVEGNSNAEPHTASPSGSATKKRHAALPWPPAIDPYRLRRALELDVEHASAETLRISGGGRTA